MGMCLGRVLCEQGRKGFYHYTPPPVWRQLPNLSRKL